MVSTPDLSSLQLQLRAHLEANPDGLTEHALLKALRHDCPGYFPEQLFTDSLALYRAHFLLFHLLYRWREELLVARAGILEIDVLSIRLRPYQPGDGTAVGVADPMAAYYLELNNLEQTRAEDVDELLGGFWARYYANSRRAEALAVLGLDDPVTDERIQQRYRQLAMAHHPDRGGDAAGFQRLQQAIAVLRKC